MNRGTGAGQSKRARLEPVDDDRKLRMRSIWCPCGHLIGNTTPVAVVVGENAPTTGGHLSNLPGLTRLAEPHSDGRQRFGLREGAFRKGRDPVRRPSWKMRNVQVHDGLVAVTPGLEMTIEVSFYAKCLRCGRFVLVDLNTPMA